MFTLSDAMRVIALKPEFFAKNKGTYTIIDYNVKYSSTFIGSTPEESQILLNLRGTAFDNNSGKIIRIGYHTFFNHGENPELDKQIDLAHKHVILQKLDGSCIYPVYINDGYVLGTRAGETSVSQMANDWLNELPHRVEKYHKLIIECNHTGVIPIFELCSRMNQVVIDYPNTNLVLTGIRDIVDGRYLEHAIVIGVGHAHGIPVVASTEQMNNYSMDEIIERVRDFEDDEGVVIRFESGPMCGHMVKIKSADYVMRHKAVDGLKYAKDVMLLCFNNTLDDVYPIISDDLKVRVKTFVESLHSSILDTCIAINQEYTVVKELSSQAEFAAAVKNSKYKHFLFVKRKTHEETYDLVLNYCKTQCSTQASSAALLNFLGMSAAY